MELTRRFIFHGSAAAYGGRFVRPEDVVLASTGGSALPVTGGRSVWRQSGIKIGRSFRIRAAETSAEGLVDNLKDAIRFTHQQLDADALSATTRVSVRCRGIEVGGAPPAKRGDEPEPMMVVGDVSATLLSRSARPGHESSVIVEGAAIAPVTFDSPVHGRFRLDVHLDVKTFQVCDTRQKIIENKGLLQKHGDHDMVFTTIVSKIEWQKGRSYPEARMRGTNGVYIPNLGAFYFGELIVRNSTRRLTMIRMDLGSPTGGSGSVGDLDSNGTWSE